MEPQKRLHKVVIMQLLLCAPRPFGDEYQMAMCVEGGVGVDRYIHFEDNRGARVIS